jgi:NADPH2:quinone reductase
MTTAMTTQTNNDTTNHDTRTPAETHSAGAPLTRVPELPRSVVGREARASVPRPTVGRLRLRPARRGRGFIVGSVDAAGPDTNGFAPRDRVAWRDSGEELDELLLIDQDDVLGVPSWVSDEQVVSYLGAGLIARALVRTRPFARGDQVRVVSTDPVVADLTAAWARSLGARIVDPAVETARISIHDEPRVRRTVLGSHGKLAQAAVEVFQAIRAGVFDGVPTVSDSGSSIAA